MNTSIPTWKIIYGIAYGGIIAVAYLFVRLRGQQGGLDLFCSASLFLFLGHFLIWPRSTIEGLQNRKMLVRGALFGITQVLIFKAQELGHTSTALVAATMGSVFGVIIGRLVLGERVRGIAALAAGLCLAATFTNPALILVSYWGVVSGALQGSGYVLSRTIMLENKSIRQSVSSGFGIAGACALLALLLSPEQIIVSAIAPADVAFTATIAVLIQYSFFYLWRWLDTQRASTLSLSRIPWILAIESAVFGRLPTIPQFASGILVVLGSALFILESRKVVRPANEQRATV